MGESLISDVDLDQLKRQLPSLDPRHKARVLELLEERDRLYRLNEARTKFLPFVKAVWPAFIPGAHHQLMAEKFEQVANGTCKRLIINMAPRHTKSELASWLLPAWFLGRFPDKKIIQASATEDLASGFGRKVRNLVGGEYEEDDQNPGGISFSEIFPGVSLSKDSKAASGWHTNKQGEYFAIGVNGRVTGKGGNIVILDDVHTEQEAKQAEFNPAIYDAAYEWYKAGPRQRLQPGGAIIIVMTRWSMRDLTGRLLEKQKNRAEGERGDKWDVLELPAILDEGTPTERSMWPAFWPLEELQNTREEIGPILFRAQYMQQPTSEKSAIIKREYWRRWGASTERCPDPRHATAWHEGSPPACKYTLGSWDCASTKNERSHPSAYTLWGIFEAEDPDSGLVVDNIILLSAYKARMEFPELKKRAKEFYEEDMPDTLLIENKSAGMQLLQEFRAMGLPAESFTGSNRGGGQGFGNDKIARANSVSDIFASRFVWAPERPFAETVITQCAEFPAGSEDDLLDSTVQAMLRFRQGGFIRTANDEPEDNTVHYRRKRFY